MITRLHTRSAVAIAAAGLLAPSTAWAHAGHDESLGLLSGLTHPITGFDHLVAMALVGVWAALFAPKTRAALLVPAAFVAAMAIGFAGSSLFAAIPAEALIIASLVVLGIAAGAGLRAPMPLAIGAAGIFGFAHGLAHGFETPEGAFPALFALGFLASTAALHGFGMLAARFLPAALTRGASAVAAAGVLVAAGTA